MNGPSVTIAIPVRNEEEHLEACLASISRQTYGSILEILVVDGDSTDRTVELAEQHEGVTVLANPARIQAAALNVALDHAGGDVFVRVDGHCVLDPDYVQRCVRALQEHRAGLVGGAMRPVATQWFGRGVVAAMTRPLGAGPARFHTGGEAGWVETVYLGAGWTAELRAAGGYATDVGVNEDTELAHRMGSRGGVWFEPAIRSTYVPRNSLRAVARQFLRYGLSRAATTKRHPASLQPRQMAAPALVLALALFPRRRLVLGLYAAAVLREAAAVAVADPPAGAAVLAVLPAMHFGWGLGFLAGLAGWRPPQPAAAS